MYIRNMEVDGGAMEASNAAKMGSAIQHALHQKIKSIRNAKKQKDALIA